MERTSEPVFRSIKYLATLSTQLNYQITEAYFKIIESLETFMRNGSGWQIDQVTKLEIEITQFSPIYVNSYIPLPAKLEAKMCKMMMINVVCGPYQQPFIRYHIIPTEYLIIYNANKVLTGQCASSLHLSLGFRNSKKPITSVSMCLTMRKVKFTPDK